MTEQPLSLAGQRPDAPTALVAAVEHALAKRPEDRWQDAGALRDALETGTTASFTGAPVALAKPAGDSPPTQGAVATQKKKKRKKKEDSLEVFTGKPLEERIRIARRDAFVGGAGILAFVGVNAVTWPWLWWTVFPAFFMSWSVVAKVATLWSEGVPLRAIFRSNAVGQAVALPASASASSLAPSDVLAGPHGPAVRRAAEDRAHIQLILRNLSKADRELVPEVLPTVDALAERIASLAQMLHRLDHDIAPGTVERLNARIAEVEREGASAIDHERRLSLLTRQRTTLTDLAERRGRVARQLESAGLALENLRLDLLKLRSSGVQAAIHDVQNATQEARALSREIGHVLEAAEEVRRL
jgi:hypothetical protein